MEQEILQGKLKISAVLKLETGLHIGGSDEFAPIGAVDSSFIRDPFTKQPVIPGSSLKGKIRSLLRHNEGVLSNDESSCIKRLFGTGNDKKELMKSARLQFYDIKMTKDSVKELAQLDMDTYLGEVKFENTINPVTGVANPRQIERVPAGAVFDFQLVYNIVKLEEVKEDMQKLTDGIQLLEWDYLGGSGSRGYGRVVFTDWKVTAMTGSENNEAKKQADMVEKMLKESVKA